MATRKIIFLAALLPLAACDSGTQNRVVAVLNSPIPTPVASDAKLALKAYQDALGGAEQAVQAFPSLEAKLQDWQAKLAPYVADANQAVVQVSTAPTLATAAAEITLETAAYYKITPNLAAAK